MVALSICHTRWEIHRGDSPQSRHSTITFRGSASPLITEYPIAMSHQVLHTTAMLTRDKHAASGCTHAPITACLIFFLSFLLSLFA